MLVIKALKDHCSIEMIKPTYDKAFISSLEAQGYVIVVQPTPSAEAYAELQLEAFKALHESKNN